MFSQCIIRINNSNIIVHLIYSLKCLLVILPGSVSFKNQQLFIDRPSSHHVKQRFMYRNLDLSFEISRFSFCNIFRLSLS